MQNEHTLMCVMGESCSGKDNLVSTLCRKNNWTNLVSYTTRPQRQNEGTTHIFVDESMFESMKENNEIAVYTYLNGSYYWATTDLLYDSDFYIINPAAVAQLKALNIPNLRIVTVYINVPEEIREEHAKARGDNPVVYKSRRFSEHQQFREMKKNMDVDYVIPNNDFAKAYSVLKWICEVEGLWKNHVEENAV